jgi:tellurite resistance protein TerA
MPDRVVLTKSSPTGSLTKSQVGGSLRVNLRWNAAQPKGLFRKAAAIDLDLACLYELSSGKGVVQALGNAFASPAGVGGRPVVTLDGDDRSGSSEGGENLTVDLAQLESIRRLLVFTYIYEGTPNWASAAAVVTLTPADGAAIEVRLDEHDPSAKTCAIAMLENVGGALRIRREVRYINGMQRQLDEAYGWGMNWQSGRK